MRECAGTANDGKAFFPRAGGKGAQGRSDNPNNSESFSQRQGSRAVPV